jgi:hypothetical protein
MAFWRKARRDATGQEPSQIRVAGLDQPVCLRRTPRARRLSLRINEAKRGAVLTMPPYASYAEAGDFLARHFDWLQLRLAELPSPVPFIDGASVPLRGEQHELRIFGNAQGRAKVWCESGMEDAGSLGNDVAARSLAINRICVKSPAAKAPARLVHWLKGEARDDISRQVAHHAQVLGVTPARLSIRDQSTRWGSCSATGALSFSWRLILAPSFVLDYVAAHEVAHLRELNHSERFWALVRNTMPRLDEARTWLRKHGPRLHQYGSGH